MKVSDYLDPPEMEMTHASLCRRVQAMEQLLELLFERIEAETGEELTSTITTIGYIPIFGPTRAEKEAFEAKP